MHGLGNIVPPSDPDSTTSANFITIPPGILILLIIKMFNWGKLVRTGMMKNFIFLKFQCILFFAPSVKHYFQLR
jgi:hypothetical protein